MGWMGESDSPDVSQGGPWNLPNTQPQGFDWSKGFSTLGQGLLGALPGMASTGAGALINKMMPGQNQLVDTRTPEARQASQFGMSRLNSLTANPMSFGLPGDPMDPNTPAGNRYHGIVQGSRAADAARGMFTTGGSAQRETDAVNSAIANSYNQNVNSAMQGAAGSGWQSMRLNAPPMENPWAKLLGAAVSPAVSASIQGLLKGWGLS